MQQYNNNASENLAKKNDREICLQNFKNNIINGK